MVLLCVVSWARCLWLGVVCRRVSLFVIRCCLFVGRRLFSFGARYGLLLVDGIIRCCMLFVV